MKTQARSENVLWGVGSIVVIYVRPHSLRVDHLASFKPGDELGNGKFLPRSLTLDNYSKVFQNDSFLAALRNSLSIA